MLQDPVVIVSAKRTPIGHFNGVFKDVASPKLGGCVIESVSRNGSVDAVLMGCVLSAGLGQAPARQAALYAKLPITTPCTTINKMCGSGMKAVMIAADEIKSGHAEMVIAGGMENMSRAPYLLANARAGLRIGAQTLEDHMMLDGLMNAYEPHASMGALAEKCAKKFNITRELQDAFALESLKRATHATRSGLFQAEIAPITVYDKKNNAMVITEDEGIQKGIPEKIPTLKPAFAKEGTITAANASSISDGAAALLLMSQTQAKKLNVKPLARIVDYCTIAQEPEWFSTAPIVAIEKLLSIINWRMDSVDLFEINEAFAVVVLAAVKKLSIPLEKVNVHGGACVLGHPIGASGARILVTLIHALKQRNKKRGVAALCIGGGEATAMAVEMI